MMDVNYIAAFYIGDRVHFDYNKSLKCNPLFMLEKHIESLKDTDIKLVTFVFNLDDLSVAKAIEEKINSYNISFNYECYFRENKGCSYGAWNDVMIKNLNDFDYFFLIEDDYVPVVKDFYQSFIDKCTDVIPYVCGLVDTSSDGLLFPSISNGIMNARVCKSIYNKHKTILKIYNEDNLLDTFYRIQMDCYEYFIKEGFGITDILDKYSVPFMSSITKQITTYGNVKNPVLLAPVLL